MRVMFLRPVRGKVAARCRRQLESTIPPAHREIYHNLHDLTAALGRFENRDALLVLIPADRMGLVGLAAERDRLMAHKCILILPDGTEETFKLGHLLYPRFVTDQASNFGIAARVLTGVLEHMAAIES